MLMCRALITCLLDAGEYSQASAAATKAATFVKQHAPAMFKTLFALMVSNVAIAASFVFNFLNFFVFLNLHDFSVFRFNTNLAMWRII